MYPHTHATRCTHTRTPHGVHTHARHTMCPTHTPHGHGYHYGCYRCRAIIVIFNDSARWFMLSHTICPTYNGAVLIVTRSIRICRGRGGLIDSNPIEEIWKIGDSNAFWIREFRKTYVESKSRKLWKIEIPQKQRTWNLWCFRVCSPEFVGMTLR